MLKEGGAAHMRNGNQHPPMSRLRVGRSLTWTGLILLLAAFVGAFGMICQIVFHVLDLPWFGTEGVYLGAAACLCMLAMIGFIIALTALCVQRDLWAILTFLLSFAVGSLCLLNLVLVWFLCMAASNPV